MTAGLRVLCLSNMWPGPVDPDYGAFVAEMCGALEDLGMTVDPVFIDRRAGGPARTPAKYGSLAARAARHARRADVIYAHYLFPTAAAAALAGRTAGIPYVVTAHGGDVRNLERATVRRASAASLRSAAAIVAVSRHLAQELRATGVALPPVHVVNMGVDMDRFTPGDRGEARARLGLDGDAPLILAVGGLTDRKNPIGLLQALVRVRAARPTATVAFVGDGPLARAVDIGAARMGLEGAVIRTGALPHDRVADWVAACDMLAMVSRVEPLGVAALEGLAGGRPVVATRVGGTREVVPVPRAGRVVDPLDPVAIATAILDLLDHPPSARACRAAAAPNALPRQARKVAAILEAAVARRANEGGVSETA